MKDTYNIERFLIAQESVYENAFSEMKNGRKRSHWMWFIFPQIHGLGFSETAKFYAVKNEDEALLYFQHNILGNRLIEITTALLSIEDKSAYEVFGSPDDLKLKSCMTLFSEVSHNLVFQQVLDKFYKGEKDEKTLRLLVNSKTM